MVKNISFHYTNPHMVRDLLAITPYTGTVLDAGSGKNKVWYKNLSEPKLECEIEDGCDFLTQWDKQVDWVVGNPPFHLGKDFLLKASEIATSGIAMLINNQCFNSFLLPSRLKTLQERGFYINKIHVVQDKRWFGRYYYVIFTKEPNNFVTFNNQTYK